MTIVIGDAYLYALWTDAALPEESPELQELNDFYNETHLPEVLRGNPGFVRAARLERTSPTAGTGHAAARYAALYGIADEEGVDTYLARNVEGRGEPPHYSARPPLFPGALVGRGRGLYRRLELAGTGGPHTAVALLVARDTTPSVSLGAALAEWGFHRASRYRLVSDLNGPETSSPLRFDLFEAGTATADDCLKRYGASPSAGTSPSAESSAAIVYRLLSATTRSEALTHPAPADR